MMVPGWKYCDKKECHKAYQRENYERGKINR